MELRTSTWGPLETDRGRFQLEAAPALVFSKYVRHITLKRRVVITPFTRMFTR